MDADELDWNRTLREQWEFHGNHQLRAQLDGLTDEEPVPEAPMADLVLHIHRELIHHVSEVCLLRDLYLHTKPATNGATR